MPPQSTNINEESKQVTFSQEEYPQLSGIQVGAEISGKRTGTVAEVAEDGSVTVNYESTEIETENGADRELSKLKNNEHNKSESYEEDEDEY